MPLPPASQQPDRFRTTRWSLVVAAGDSAHPDSREALARLCETYWPPVYAYIRGRGHDPESARDLTQGFFTQLIDRKTLSRVRPEGGKFRAYLLTCIKHFLGNEREREDARKRGGGTVTIPLDVETAERLCVSDDSGRTPEDAFERRWGLLVLRRSLARLEDETEARGGGVRFRRLRPYLDGDRVGASYRQVAEELGISEGAVKMAVHRMRRRFGDLLRNEVAETLTDPTEVEEELQFLRRAIRS